MTDSDYKLLSDLMPRYDGNPKQLKMYISNVESLLSLFKVVGELDKLVVCLIKSRLSGSALDVLACEKSLDTWAEIKNALLSRLSDPRNEIQLMQELTRSRRLKSEDSESFGKRLREILETLYLVGNNPDKTYYEQMVIEQYVNQLEFHVSLGVRINKPMTLEAAILAARQEEARLACNPPPSMIQQKARVDFNRNGNFTRSPMPTYNTNNFQPQFAQNVQPQSSWPEPRSQPRQPMLTWHQKQNQGNPRHGNGSGNFRNSGNFRQPNIPQSPAANRQQKVSDVTMRSVSKPITPNFGQQDLFYMPQEQPYVNHVQQEFYADGGECSYVNYQGNDVMYEEECAQAMGTDCTQDFPLVLDEKDLS